MQYAVQQPAQARRQGCQKSETLRTNGRAMIQRLRQHQNTQRQGQYRSTSLGLTLLLTGILSLVAVRPGEAQSANAITLRADVQEANAGTGIVTARGNVRIDYPAREISATAAQAQYYSQEQRIVLTGNVFIQQEGNTLRAETATYLIDEERFVATPGASQQVESTYILPETTTAPQDATESEELPTLPIEDSVPTELPNLPIEQP